MRFGIFMSQYPAMQQRFLHVKPVDACRLSWTVVVRILHMYAIGLFFMIRIINKTNTHLNERLKPRSARPAVLFHPSLLLGGVLYNIKRFSTRDISKETVLLRSSTDDRVRKTLGPTLQDFYCLTSDLILNLYANAGEELLYHKRTAKPLLICEAPQSDQDILCSLKYSGYMLLFFVVLLSLVSNMKVCMDPYLYEKRNKCLHS